MSDPDNTPNGSKQDWEGFREVDRAIAEDRLSKYSVQKAWADPWERKALYLTAFVIACFVIYVIIYDGLI
ncbi:MULTISPECIES: hypothetical protein [Sphingomonadales]|jgi:hypothetical protein|uniref:Uncharacterized protein n=2 Tax=Erythrobacteraceae TaxID=335929 RepID=A0A5S3NXQ1_9SPHN|nr:MULTISPECIES: hypothetical protein [Sphingomonadales]ABC62948.1 hypothetical protein ELI_04280 [Erythrobacter litoralis HTCC2594]MAQ29633.1 hypothetical protein [Erythrobacter sp.]MEE4208856.1 hypothetical protein [Parvularcula sp.]TMM44846.1 hypothetical protein FEV51_13020 [Qipengyuania marisflavi]